MNKLAIGILLLTVGCAPTSTPTTTTQPSSSPSSVESPAPPSPVLVPISTPKPEENQDILEPVSPTPSPSATSTIVLPSPTPLPSTTPIPTPAPTIRPSPKAHLLPSSPLAIPKYLGDCPTSTPEDKSTRATMRGKVVNENGVGVFGVAIRIRSLSECNPYGYQTKTNSDGRYEIKNVPSDYPLEIEVAAPSERSIFYKTQLLENNENVESINYFPFQIKKREPLACIALAPSPANINGKIDISKVNLPDNTEFLVHLRSMDDDCNGFDQQKVTTMKEFSIDVFVLGGTLGQLSISSAGRPTKVRYPLIPDNRQSPNVVEYDVQLSPSSSELEELNPIWDSETFYAGFAIDE